MSKTIELTIPDEFVGTPFEQEYLATAQQIIKEQTVLRLYQEAKISTGRGARIMEMCIYDFIQFLGKHQVSIFRYEEGELEADLGNAQRQARHDAIATYAVQNAGTDADLIEEMNQPLHNT